MKTSKTPAVAPKRKQNAIIAAPKGDDNDDGEDDDDDDDGDDGEEVKEPAKVGSSSLPKGKKRRKDYNQKRTKINKLQLSKGVRRVKVGSKWMILDPEVSACVFV